MKYWILESEKDDKKIYLVLPSPSRKHLFSWSEEIGYAHVEHTREEIAKLIDVLKECKEKEEIISKATPREIEITIL